MSLSGVRLRLTSYKNNRRTIDAQYGSAMYLPENYRFTVFVKRTNTRLLKSFIPLIYVH